MSNSDSDRPSHPPSPCGSVDTPSIAPPTDPALRGYGRGRARRPASLSEYTPPVGSGAWCYTTEGTNRADRPTRVLDRDAYAGASAAGGDREGERGYLYTETREELGSDNYNDRALGHSEGYDLWLAARRREHALQVEQRAGETSQS